jgi:hypothetical protein
MKIYTFVTDMVYQIVGSQFIMTRFPDLLSIIHTKDVP